MAFLFGDSNGKKELYRKILGTIDPGAKEGVCALYDTADGKCAEGMSVRKIAEIAARGMMGTPTAEPELATNWVLGPTFSDLSDPTGERKEIVTLFMTFEVLRNAFYPSEGAVIGSRDAEGEVAAVNVVRLYRSGYVKHFGERLWDLRIILGELIAGTMPAVYTDSKRKKLRKYLDARTKEAVELLLPRLHIMHAPGPHYHVAIMATLPENQGQGHCSKVMRAINRAADADQLPCYLECSGEKNKRVYARFGYKVVGQYSLSVEDDPEPGSSVFSDLFCMVRAPGDHGSLVNK